MVMQIDLNQEDLNPGAWFYFDEADPEGGGACVRVVNNEALEAIREKSVTKKVDYYRPGRGQPVQRFEYFDSDEDLEFEETWKYCIVDWKGVVDPQGNEIPCTDENKIRLMKEHLPMIRFVTQCQTKINEALLGEAEGEEKNLLTSQEVS